MNKRLRAALLLLLLIPSLSLALWAAPGEKPPGYKDRHATVEARVRDLLGRMTLEEKIDLLHGNEMETHPNERLGIPSLKMTDGPIGVRWQRATSFPAAICWAAAFDPALLDRITAALATETLANGRDMLLGPCVNIARAPQGGRNFESFGEDPYLSSVYAETYVRGLQGRGVMASTKHFAINDQEHERMTIDMVADERTLNEIHFPAFLAAVRAGTWSVMCAYNRVNGTYASESDALLDGTLKKGWGFRGFVISDWGATHSTVPAALHGLDLEMPQGDFFGRGKLLEAVKAGKVPAALIDDKVTRILRAMFAMGVFDRKSSDRPAASTRNSKAHRDLALEVARQGIVLLKNERDILPLAPPTRSAKRPLRVALIGPNAAVPREGGGGSSRVTAVHAVSPLEGLRDRARTLPARSLEIRHAAGLSLEGDIIPLPSEAFRPADGPAPTVGAPVQHGLRAEYFDNPNLEGAPVATRLDPSLDFSWGEGGPDPKVPVNRFSARWTGILTPKVRGRLAFRNDDGARVYLDDRLVLEDWRGHAPETHMSTVDLEPGRSYRVRVEYYEETGEARFMLGYVPPQDKAFDEAVRLAGRSDVAIVFVGFSDRLESEGIDRASLSLPGRQDALVEAVAKANPRTIVVLNGGGSTLMPWIARVPAVLQSWYPGEQGGAAVADILLGRVNPSGKLPVSFYRRPQDASSHGTYPGKGGRVRYTEGVFVGYRHLDRARIQPLFPFGHGLSYTRFDLRDLRVRPVRASHADPLFEATVSVRNTGRRAGAEVVQLYVHDDGPALPRPVQELKGFRRVTLAPGEAKTVTFRLDRTAFAWYDAGVHRWRTRPGTFTLRVGASSRDIRAERRVRLQ